MPPKNGVINACIAREEGPSIKRIISPDGQSAETVFETLRQANGRALVSLQLKTGRTHQIRVHMAHIGHPLTGDFLYGTEISEISRAALHSCFMEFDHPVTGRRMSFNCPLPHDMQELLEQAQPLKPVHKDAF